MQIYALSPCRLTGARRSGKIDFRKVCAKLGVASPAAWNQRAATAAERAALAEQGIDLGDQA
jgi:hypothetical protein